MKEIFEKIWKLALPYQDKRDDKGHAQITTNYALQLLKTEMGNDEIVVPAIILHDIGWSQLDKKQRMIIFDHNATRDQKLNARYKHQDASVKFAKEILNQLNYSDDLINEITEIISQHDTR
jgi:HD superfamily phosphodiesterase